MLYEVITRSRASRTRAETWSASTRPRASSGRRSRRPAAAPAHVVDRLDDDRPRADRLGQRGRVVARAAEGVIRHRHAGRPEPRAHPRLVRRVEGGLVRYARQAEPLGDVGDRRREVGAGGEHAGEAGNAGGRPGEGFLVRITSYNVCYTKLLRSTLSFIIPPEYMIRNRIVRLSLFQGA